LSIGCDDDPLVRAGFGERRCEIVGGRDVRVPQHPRCERDSPIGRALQRLGEFVWKRVLNVQRQVDPDPTEAGTLPVRLKPDSTWQVAEEASNLERRTKNEEQGTKNEERRTTKSGCFLTVGSVLRPEFLVQAAC
jgi:hypothetical protein